MATVHIDYQKPLGPMKIMHSVNNAPVGNRERGAKNMSNFRYFEEAGIPYCRNHDASFYSGYEGEYIVDVHRIFRNFDADVNDPASYDFEYTDIYVKNVESVGAHTFYRLGSRIEHGKEFGTLPPKDYFKYAQICEHIIRHYTEGWADGFTYDMEYWEIWNEPDNLRSCWGGPIEEFYKFFLIMFKHLKSCFPHLKIGGPALTHSWHDEINHALFDLLRDNGLMLDFYSFHGYNHNPHEVTDNAQNAYDLLCEYGWQDHTELILNEWNYIQDWRGDDYIYSIHVIKDNGGFKASSFIAATMAVGQSSRVDHMMYYDAMPGTWNSMFDTYFLTPMKGYYPFKMFGQMYRMGEQISAASDDNDVYAVAARGDGMMGVMATYFDNDDNAPEKEMTVVLDHLPADGMKTVEYYLLDAEHDMVLYRTDRTTAGQLQTVLPLGLYTTWYIKVTV